MALQPNTTPEIKRHGIHALQQALDQMTHVGELTQVNHKTNSHYVELIMAVGALIKELKEC